MIRILLCKGTRELFFFLPLAQCTSPLLGTLLSRDYGLVRSTKISINILVGFGQCVLRTPYLAPRPSDCALYFIKYIQSTEYLSTGTYKTS